MILYQLLFRFSYRVIEDANNLTFAIARELKANISVPL